MSHCHLQEARIQNLRQIQRQTRLLDLRLQQLRDKLCATRLHRLIHPCCLHQPCSRHLARKYLCTKLELERRMNRLKRLGMMLSSCCNPSHLIDVKGFDPRDITVVVRDGKVTVAGERKEACSTCTSKSCTYKKFIKEFRLPPGVNEVTCSVEPGNFMKIEPAIKCCPLLPKCCPVLPPKCCPLDPPPCCPVLPKCCPLDPPPCCPVLPKCCPLDPPPCCPVLPKCCPLDPPKCCPVDPCCPLDPPPCCPVLPKCCPLDPPKCCPLDPPSCCSLDPPLCCPEPEPKCCPEPEPKCCSFLCD